uniref:Uncharacterized protein n=1 Tax=Ciona intestinalis TaxID=7719 RepID=H2Y2B2_CIOIN
MRPGFTGDLKVSSLRLNFRKSMACLRVACMNCMKKFTPVSKSKKIQRKNRLKNEDKIFVEKCLIIRTLEDNQGKISCLYFECIS